MINTLALTPVLGLPAVAWGGLTTLVLLVTTVILSHRQVKYHRLCALITITVAIIHGLFGLSIFLKF